MRAFLICTCRDTTINAIYIHDAFFMSYIANGTVTITESGTMTAYATASGYSQSSNATKSCTYTMPKCTTPTIKAVHNGEMNWTITTKCATPNSTVHVTVNYGKILDTDYKYTLSNGGGVKVFAYSNDINYIEAYATADGYLQSKTAKLNL